jgi:zinc protease
MLDKGTRNLTRQQIKDKLDALKARVGVGGGASSASASIVTDREHFNEVLKLAREILREPTFPADEFDKLKQEWLAGLEQQKTDPQALGSNLYARISRPYYTADDPRYTRTFEEEARAVEAVTLDQVKQFHRDFFGASNATVAIVGEVDPQSSVELLREAFVDWKSPGPFVRIGEDYRDVAAREETVQTPDKANAVYLAGFGFPMRDDDPEYPAIAIAGHMIGGGFLNSRLATRIRQKEGLSYGVGGGFSANALDRYATFNAQMIYAPQNLAKLGQAFREEIERAARDGFTQDELEAAKTGWLKSREVSRSNDGALAGLLNGYLFLNRTVSFDAEREQKVRELTLAQVNATIKKYLDYSRMIQVKAGDFAKAAAAP